MMHFVNDDAVLLGEKCESKKLTHEMQKKEINKILKTR